MDKPLNVLLSALIILLAAGAGYVAYTEYNKRHIPDVEADGSIVSRIVDVRLEKVADIRALHLTGIAQGKACVRWWRVLNPCRVFKAPAEVDYFVDATKLGRGDFYWNGRSKVLTVEVPDIRLGNVNVDMSRVTLDQTDGIFVPQGAMVALQQQSSAAAHRAVDVEARKPANIAEARRNARDVIETLFAQPLRAAGVDADVRVRFEGEAIADGEQMDRSTSLAEIFGNHR